MPVKKPGCKKIKMPANCCYKVNYKGED